MLANFLLVGLGGAMGAMSRFALTLGYVYGIRIEGFWATMSANIIGSFLMGVAVIAIYGDQPISTNSVAAFVMTGFLGGFTTFSAFSLDSINLIQSGRVAMGSAYIALSVVLSIAALLLGMALMRGTQI